MLEHPKYGVLPTRLRQGCPVVLGERGKVEAASRRRARLRAVLTCALLAETDEEKRTAGLKGLFLQALDEILGRVDWDASRVPVNRSRTGGAKSSRRGGSLSVALWGEMSRSGGRRRPMKHVGVLGPGHPSRRKSSLC